MVSATEHKSLWLIGEIMIQKDWITWAQLREALAIQEIEGRLIGEIMVRRGYVTRHQVLRALAVQYGVPLMDLHKVKVDIAALRAVPKRYAYEHRVMPLYLENETLMVAVSNLPCDHARKVLSDLTGYSNIEVVLAMPEELQFHLGQYYGPNEVAA